MTRRKRPTLAEHDALVRDMRESLSYAHQLRRELHAARLERDAARESRDIAAKRADTAAALLRVADAEREALWESLMRACDDRGVRGLHARVLRRLLERERERLSDALTMLEEGHAHVRELSPVVRWAEVAARALVPAPLLEWFDGQESATG